MESVMLEAADADEIGDSIELAAAAAGARAACGHGFAEAGDGLAAYGSDQNAWIGGHGLDAEATTTNTDFVRRIAESLVRDWVSFADNSHPGSA